jgi:hypothetical protein
VRTGNDSGYIGEARLAVRSDGSVIVVAGYRDSPSIGDLPSLPEPADDSFFVARLNAEGTWLWVATPSAAESAQMNGGAVVLSDNSVIVAGKFFGPLAIGSLALQTTAPEGEDHLDIVLLRIGPNGELP